MMVRARNAERRDFYRSAEDDNMSWFRLIDADSERPEVCTTPTPTPSPSKTERSEEAATFSGAGTHPGLRARDPRGRRSPRSARSPHTRSPPTRAAASETPTSRRSSQRMSKTASAEWACSFRRDSGTFRHAGARSRWATDCVAGPAAESR